MRGNPLDIAKLGLEIDSTQVDKGRDALGRFTKQSLKAETAAGRVTSSAAKLGRAIGGLAVGFLSINSLGSSITQARTFGSALSEVSTLIEGTPEQLAYIQRQARSMAKDFGTYATPQVQAFYQAISAGAGSVEEANQIIDTANRLAIGGVTDIVTGVDGLTTAMNAYRAAGITAGEVSDALFVGMRAGKTTIAELSSQLGQIVPLASASGIAFDEVVAGVSALTTQGLSTASATTGLRQVIASVVKPTKEASDVAKQLGLNFNSAALESQGLAGFLEKVIEKTGGSQEIMAQLFGSVEALGAALAFSGGAGATFTQIMQDMADKSGMTLQAYEKMLDRNQRINAAMAKFRDVGISVGTALLTVAVPALEFVANNLDAINSFATAGAAVLAASYIPTLAAMGSSALVAAAGFVTLRGAMIATGIGALVVGLGLAIMYFNKLVVATGGWGSALQALGDLAKGVWDGIKTSAKSIGPALNAVWLTIQAGFVQVISNIQKIWADFLHSAVAGARAAGADEIALGLHEYAVRAGATVYDLQNRVSDFQGQAAAAKDEAKALVNEGWQKAVDAMKTLILQMDVANAEMDNGANAADELKKALEGLGAGAATTASSVGGLGDDVGTLGRKLKKTPDDIDHVANGIDGISRALAGAATRGEDLRENMANVFEGIAYDILQSGIKEAILEVFDFEGAKGGGGGFFSTIGDIVSGIFGGFRESGGPVQSDKGYIVGEKGPEWFEPKTSGTIIPNHQLGGESGRVQVEVLVNDDGKIGAIARSEAQNVSVRVIEAGLGEYDRALPDRVQEISNDPRGR
ncbi:phage tail tape measure protein [Shimia sagamensis]|uniref:phage tail tape measure protein n=1 Tax=Shimia sagamensis TaxID=1566352 RepID=UPI0024B69F59|nr:phage tail tape measure protein [Shimia sagamensis]